MEGRFFIRVFFWFLFVYSWFVVGDVGFEGLWIKVGYVFVRCFLVFLFYKICVWVLGFVFIGEVLSVCVFLGSSLVVLYFFCKIVKGSSMCLGSWVSVVFRGRLVSCLVIVGVGGFFEFSGFRL